MNELANDEVIKSAMPDEMYTVYNHYKTDEWERFNAHCYRLGFGDLYRLLAIG